MLSSTDTCIASFAPEIAPIVQTLAARFAARLLLLGHQRPARVTRATGRVFSHAPQPIGHGVNSELAGISTRNTDITSSSTGNYAVTVPDSEHGTDTGLQLACCRSNAFAAAHHTLIAIGSVNRCLAPQRKHSIAIASAPWRPSCATIHGLDFTSNPPKKRHNNGCNRAAGKVALNGYVTGRRRLIRHLLAKF